MTATVLPNVTPQASLPLSALFPAAASSIFGRPAVQDSAAVAEQPPATCEQASLVQLVEGCLRKDADAQRAFVAKYERLLMTVSLRMLRDRHEAEDVVQESFARIFRSLDRWDRQRPIVPWLMTITVNRCRTALQRRTRRAKPSAMLPPIEAPVAADQLERDEQRQQLDQLVSELPDNWREAFQLYYGAELSVPEVAETLGCAEGTVKTWLFRGRQRLAQQLRVRGGDDV